jgi:flavin reductase (DIM6/NTAB) family NADH-FMN oxidoreductase RutF
MHVDVSKVSVVEAYHLIVSLVTPRPIAWVSTLSPSGVVNLAPFSFYNAFGANPPIVVFSPTLKRDGTKKDTLRNLESLGEFVIHAATETHVEQINLSSKMIPPEESEVELVGMTTVPSTLVKPPRLADVPFALECKVREILPMGTGPIAANLVIGEVLMMHIDDSVLDSSGIPDPTKIKAIARLGGEYWCKTQDLFQLKRH